MVGDTGWECTSTKTLLQTAVPPSNDYVDLVGNG